MPTMKGTNICGVKFSDVSIRELRNILVKRLKGPDYNYFIVTPNVDFIVRAKNNAHFQDILNKADLSLCDSEIVKIAASFLGYNIKEKITGWDLLTVICKRLGRKSKYFILGGNEEDIIIAAHELERSNSDVKIVGFHHGYFGKDKDREIISIINSVNTDILIIGMGSPRQELWVDKNKEFLKTKIIMCVGGIIDIVAGKTNRAPVWMQKAGLEWSWRLILEPKRLWRRYLIDDMGFFYLLLKERLKNKL
jgi:N-acetylglucosaminyldiphosphoundecaprenol N-acetyl-beta-D-mannosaminyltransferase